MNTYSQDTHGRSVSEDAALGIRKEDEFPFGCRLWCDEPCADAAQNCPCMEGDEPLTMQGSEMTRELISLPFSRLAFYKEESK